MKEAGFLDPVRFFKDPTLLSGAIPDGLPEGTEIVASLERAMLLENSQDLPPGYRIWNDFFPAAVSHFYSTAIAREGEHIIEKTANEIWTSLGNFEQELHKKRIRKTISELERFWLTTAYDMLEQLKMIALGRYCEPGRKGSDLEQAYRVFTCGFYPCGVRTDGSLAAFDPRTLSRAESSGV